MKEEREGVPLVGALERTAARLKVKLSTRAYNVLDKVLFEKDERVNRKGLTDVELLRATAKLEPPLSFQVLRARYRNCGVVTAKEICAAMGLPVEQSGDRVQCPRCGHAFGGQR